MVSLRTSIHFLSLEAFWNNLFMVMSIKDFTFDLARELLSHADKLDQQEDTALFQDENHHEGDIYNDNGADTTKTPFKSHDKTV